MARPLIRLRKRPQQSSSPTRRRSVSIFLGSSVMLPIVVNVCVVGLLVGSTMVASGAGFDWAIGCGLAVGLLYSAAFIATAERASVPPGRTTSRSGRRRPGQAVSGNDKTPDKSGVFICSRSGA